MKKIFNLLHSIVSLIVSVIVYCIYAPYAVVKALTDMNEFLDFMEDAGNAIGRTRYSFQKLITRRKTKNIIIQDCINSIKKQHDKGSIDSGTFLLIRDTLERKKNF